VIEEAEEVKS